MLYCFLFFFNDTATTEIYTFSLHDALPIYLRALAAASPRVRVETIGTTEEGREILVVAIADEATMGDLERYKAAAARLADPRDRKSTRLNSSHANISYAVFCLKKKKTITISHHSTIKGREKKVDWR